MRHRKRDYKPLAPRRPREIPASEYRRCWRKYSLPNYLEALRVAARTAERSKNRYISTYPCEFCGYFHVGKDSQLKKTAGHINELRSRLSNKGFLNKAKPEVIELTRQRLQQLEIYFPQFFPSQA